MACEQEMAALFQAARQEMMNQSVVAVSPDVGQMQINLTLGNGMTVPIEIKHLFAALRTK